MPWVSAKADGGILRESYACLGTQLDPSFSNALAGRFWLGFDHLATNLVRTLKPELPSVLTLTGTSLKISGVSRVISL